MPPLAPVTSARVSPVMFMVPLIDRSSTGCKAPARGPTGPIARGVRSIPCPNVPISTHHREFPGFDVTYRMASAAREGSDPLDLDTACLPSRSIAFDCALRRHDPRVPHPFLTGRRLDR